MTTELLLIALISLHTNQLFMMAEITDNFEECFSTEDKLYFILPYSHYKESSDEYFDRYNKIWLCSEENNIKYGGFVENLETFPFSDGMTQLFNEDKEGK